MTSLAAQLGVTMESDPLRDAFLGWQCRARQMMMREGEGKPTDAITPAVTLPGEDKPMGHVITIMSKAPAYSVTPELEHMAKKTMDPAKWREEAMRFFAERMKMVVEPTGCLAAAALFEGVVSAPGKRVGVVISGGNVDVARLADLIR